MRTMARKHTFFLFCRLLVVVGVCGFALTDTAVFSYSHAYAQDKKINKSLKKNNKEGRKTKKTKKTKSKSGKPYFASLRQKDVSMRSGPGVRYPVQWVYTRASIPLEVLAHYKEWRRVRDWDGESGWVKAQFLAKTRFVVVTDATRALYQKPSVDSSVVAKIQQGVFAQLQRCQRSWCLVTADEHKGWLRRHEFWGTHPDERIE
ncbi:MAG: hypothetical protein GDA50_06735 [Alphaproteobacteria bacterium GM202ARS2]|nr:hypothetical protein [Alphaproteobacteria bacterium GM202ARS2]